MKPSGWRNIDKDIEKHKTSFNYYFPTINFINQFFRNNESSYNSINGFDFLQEPKRKENLYILLPHICKIFLDILNFIVLSNKLGLHAPSFSQISALENGFLDYYIRVLIEKFFQQLVPDIWESDAVALAQHHSIQTPLLDWTYNARKAAFFAIETPDESANNIAVYALPMFPYKSSFKLINVVTNENSFLRVQEALFTYDTQGDIHFLDTGTYPTLEESIGDTFQLEGYKFILPVSQISDLNSRLRAEEIHLASLMPTYDNIAKMVNEYNWKK